MRVKKHSGTCSYRKLIPFRVVTSPPPHHSTLLPPGQHASPSCSCYRISSEQNSDVHLVCSLYLSVIHQASLLVKQTGKSASSLYRNQKLYLQSLSLLHVMSFRFLMENANAGLMSRLQRRKIKSASRWWWVWGGGYYWEQFIVGAIRPCCSVWNERPSEETLSLPPNDNNTAGGSVAESRLLHLTHFIFKTHNALRFHSTGVLFLGSSAKHAAAAAVRHFRHPEREENANAPLMFDVPQDLCSLWPLHWLCITNDQVNR